MNVVYGLLALAAAAWFAAAATRSLIGAGRIAVGVVVGYAGLATAFSLVGGLASLVHHPLLRFPTGPCVAAAALGVAAFVLSRLPRSRSADASPRWPRPARWELALIIGAGLLVLLAVVTYALHPPTGFDALSYHLPMSVALFRGGTLTAPTHFLATQWDANHDVGNFPLAYPGAAESVQGLLLKAFGERSVWLLQAVFAGSLALAIGELGRRLGGRPWLPAAAVLLTPLVVFQVGIAYDDLVAVGCLVVAVLLLTTSSLRTSEVLLGAVAVGAGVATKTVLLPEAVALLVVVAVRAPRRWTLVPSAVLAVLPAAAWWARDAAVFGNPLFPVSWSVGFFHASGLPSSAYGLAAQQHNFVPSVVAWPVYPLFEKFSDTSGYGALFIVVAVPAAVLASLHADIRRSPLWRTWVLLGAVSIVAAVAFPLPTPRFQLLPVMLTMAFAGLLAPLWQRWSRLVIGLAVTGAVVTAAVAVDRLRPQLTAPLDSSTYVASRNYVEPAAAHLGAGATVWDDTSWSDYAFSAVYGLEGVHRNQRVLVGSLSGRSASAACAALPPGTDFVYVVADRGVPGSDVTRTYAAPLFDLTVDRTRRGLHGVQRRMLWSVSGACQALAHRS